MVHIARLQKLVRKKVVVVQVEDATGATVVVKLAAGVGATQLEHLDALEGGCVEQE